MFIVNIMGGLGNQLFQYNFALYLKDKFSSAEIKLNIQYFKSDSIHGGYQLKNVAFKIENKSHKNWKRITDENFVLKDISCHENIIFDGYWQNLYFFDKDYFSYTDLFNIPKDSKNTEFINLIKESSCPVSVHVRCGDYNNHFLLGNIATRAYFNNSILEIKNKNPNAVFFVFSDDIEWAKNNLNFDKSNVYYVNGNEIPEKNIYDLYLMSLCNINVISNSSFSWWAQKLNLNKQKTVITPPYWVNQKALCFNSTVSSLQKMKYMKAVSNVPKFNKNITRPVFSIIITAFNQSEYIRRTLASVLNQTFTDFEVIIVDDCSTDDTVKILNSYAKNDTRVKVFKHKKNMSSFTARKTGVLNSKGKYILFLDGDDYYFENGLERLYNEIVLKDKFDVCEFSYITRPSNNVVKPDSKASNMCRLEYFCGMDVIVTLWNKIYDAAKLKNVFEKLPDAYINLCDDTCASTCIADKLTNYIQVDIPVVNYMEGGGVSFKKLDSVVYKKFLTYINTAVSVITDYFAKSKYTEYKTHIPLIAEKRLLEWIICRSNDCKELNHIMYLMLPLYFSSEALSPYLNQLLIDADKYREGRFSFKNWLKRYIAFVKRTLKRIPFVRYVYYRL